MVEVSYNSLVAYSDFGLLGSLGINLFQQRYKPLFGYLEFTVRISTSNYIHQSPPAIAMKRNKHVQIVPSQLFDPFEQLSV